MAICCKYYDVLLWICGSAKVKNLASRGIEFELNVCRCMKSADFHRIQGENRGFPSDFTGFPADLRISDFLKSRIPGLTSKHGFEGFPADFHGFPRISLISPDPGFPPGRISDPWLGHMHSARCTY